MTAADDVVVDSKDGTWVLGRPRPECGLGASDVTVVAVADRLRAATASRVAVLARDDVRRRRRSGVWSPLADACHARDVLGVGDGGSG